MHWFYSILFSAIVIGYTVWVTYRAYRHKYGWPVTGFNSPVLTKGTHIRFKDTMNRNWWGIVTYRHLSGYMVHLYRDGEDMNRWFFSPLNTGRFKATLNDISVAQHVYLIGHLYHCKDSLGRIA